MGQTTAGKRAITVAEGDGIGPEIMDATLRILEAAGAQLDIRKIVIGEKAYNAGNTAGIRSEDWDSLLETGIFLKAPITTPQGGGFKSLNVTVRKSLGLYANVRPCRAFSPFVATKHPKMDLVIVRENEEDLYAGIEHRQTDEVYQCLKIISRPGCERIVRYAFEYAQLHGRKKVTCFTKDNIMKMTDGLFHQVFDQIGAEYPNIEKEHWIIDIGAAKMADTPEVFDVIVMPNLYGDILSDVAAQIAGSVGMAGSANIGPTCSMFEAIHGSAPRRAGQNMANPSGLLNGAVLMMNHIGQTAVAEKVANAWLKTLEDGCHTYDIYREGVSKEKVGTREFADRIIARLGQKPTQLTPVSFQAAPGQSAVARAEQIKRDQSVESYAARPAAKKELVGVDVFVACRDRNANALAERVQAALAAKADVKAAVKLEMITNRGVKVWPGGLKETFCTDHWRLRMSPLSGGELDRSLLWKLPQLLMEKDLEVIKTENLYTFDGVKGFSLGQGQ